jgi:hypothetical protein
VIELDETHDAARRRRLQSANTVFANRSLKTKNVELDIHTPIGSAAVKEPVEVETEI